MEQHRKLADKISSLKDWADTMTEKYAELSRRMPIFSDLQNIMDMTIVATLISQEGLARKANLDLNLFTVKSDDLPSPLMSLRKPLIRSAVSFADVAASGL